jgi:phenylpyruvate tautomerase PptA (4-oxalocrotonate tautomerase family)
MIKRRLCLPHHFTTTTEPDMPLTRVSLRRGKPPAYRKAILESLYLAMRETFAVPESDRFMTLSEHDEDDFVYGADYLGIQRSDDLVIIQLTVSNTRPVEQKQKLYRRIVERLTESPGLRAEDIFINLVEVLPENWSFGLGEAQYVFRRGLFWGRVV